MDGCCKMQSGESRRDLERMDYTVSRHPEFRYKTEFQSHEPEVIIICMLMHQLILRFNLSNENC